MKVLAVQPDPDSPPGLIGAALEGAGIGLEVWEPRFDPPPAGPYDGIVVLGSITNPDDDRFEPWLAAVRGEISLALELGIPLLGVCLGAQLLTEELGGSTARMERPEIGWAELRPTAHAAGDPLFGAMPGSGASLLQWHRYSMTPPSDSVSLIEPTSCEQAWCSTGQEAWAVQFHFEADAAIVDEWTDSAVDQLAALGLDPAGLRAATRLSAPAAESVGLAIAGGFASVVASRKRS